MSGKTNWALQTLFLVFVLVGWGCGTRTALRDFADSGTADGSPHPAPDLRLCTDEVRVAMVGETIQIIRASVGNVRLELEEPSASARLDYHNFTADQAGRYSILWFISSENGRQSTCRTFVDVVDELALLECSLQPVEALRGIERSTRIQLRTALEPNVEVLFVSGPTTPAFSVSHLSNFEGVDLSIVASQVGTYLFRIVALEDGGEIASCQLTVEVAETPTPICPTLGEAQVGFPLSLPARDERGYLGTWFLVGPVDGSSIDNEMRSFVPANVGSYTLSFSIGEDRTASCETNVRAVLAEQRVLCPEAIDLESDAVALIQVEPQGYTSTEVTQSFWSILEAPEGSNAELETRAEPNAVFLAPDFFGDYRVQHRRVSARGESSCETLVRVRNPDFLRVEMRWSTNQSDFDLHVLNPGGTRWFSDADCHFVNCLNGLGWGEPGVADDADLNVDNRTGRGPERVVVRRPEPGIYDIAVHAFSNNSTTSQGEATVRIWCGESDAQQLLTIGPQFLENDIFWRVARVEVSQEHECSIRSLALPNGPNLSSRSNAEQER